MVIVRIKLGADLTELLTGYQGFFLCVLWVFKKAVFL
jgi:hypothetical protein